MQSAGPTRSILDSLRRVVAALRVSAVAAEREGGLSAAQLFVLHRLGESPASSLNELAARTHTHQSSVSVVVRRLVERGLVERGPSAEDGRRLELRLSAAGAALRRSAAEPVQARMVRAIGRLSPSDRRALDRSLGRLVREMGVAGPAPLFFEGEAAPRAANEGRAKRSTTARPSKTPTNVARATHPTSAPRPQKTTGARRVKSPATAAASTRRSGK